MSPIRLVRHGKRYPADLRRDAHLEGIELSQPNRYLKSQRLLLRFVAYTIGGLRRQGGGRRQPMRGGEIEKFHHVVCSSIASAKRRYVKPYLDEAQDGCEIAPHMGDIIGFRHGEITITGTPNPVCAKSPLTQSSLVSLSSGMVTGFTTSDTRGGSHSTSIEIGFRHPCFRSLEQALSRPCVCRLHFHAPTAV